ncbi:MAG TPA: hypothetical protein VLT10_00600 [Verrucomicrobiae bacterium]|nr:hypothetical protein [Verrucomicrobiae bacterium]
MNFETFIGIKGSIAFLARWHKDYSNGFDLMDLIERKLALD